MASPLQPFALSQFCFHKVGILTPGTRAEISQCNPNRHDVSDKGLGLGFIAKLHGTLFNRKKTDIKKRLACVQMDRQ